MNGIREITNSSIQIVATKPQRMKKNLEDQRKSIDLSPQARSAPLVALGMGEQLRAQVKVFLKGLLNGSVPLHLPETSDDWISRGEGHFHLEPQLFLQVSGWTRFYFPHSEQLLQAGEALLVPPRLLHLEKVGSGSDGRPFSNIVVFAEHGTMSCHLAHEIDNSTPDVMYLEASKNPHALLIQEWMGSTAKLGREALGEIELIQTRSLLATILAGVLRALDAPQAESAESPLVARVRIFVQSQLGEQELSVKRLAEQSGCTADYLSHVFHQTTGEHLIAYINRQRIARATTLLKESDLSGKEIAWACGFASQSYFIKTFREQFKMTPQTWRMRR
jgi:AraC-like DNA-binding protein